MSDCEGKVSVFVTLERGRFPVCSGILIAEFISRSMVGFDQVLGSLLDMYGIPFFFQLFFCFGWDLVLFFRREEQGEGFGLVLFRKSVDDEVFSKGTETKTGALFNTPFMTIAIWSIRGRMVLVAEIIFFAPAGVRTTSTASAFRGEGLATAISASVRMALSSTNTDRVSSP